MSHPVIAAADAVKTLLATQSFAAGVTVTAPRNPCSNLEGLTGTRFECVAAQFERRRVTRNKSEEEVAVDIHVEKLVDFGNIDADIDTMLQLSYEVLDYVTSAVPSGWNAAPGETQEPLYSLDDIRQTGEFRSVIRATYQRVVET